ncbi:hypothetical protein [Limnochorda pilosa]|uniref:Uncharacterized protein n=1 Tax=Limnochorda pilosa TaxID=1555112 RepID=A0A0K2SKK7_LIMPI|nr:hypothetical protein [Limnochorda pilosa]BAS27379.1 hypothetical protein LIP_1532 [Limnochorda pilosa]
MKRTRFTPRGASRAAGPVASEAAQPRLTTRRGHAGLALLLALLMVLPAGLAVSAQAPAALEVRPQSSGGQDPVLNLPAYWRPAPGRLYRREVLLHLQMELLGMPGQGAVPMEARTRQEWTVRTSNPAPDGSLYLILAMGKPEVLEGTPELTQQLAQVEASTIHVKAAPDGRWEVVRVDDGKGRPVPEMDEAALKRLAATLQGPGWPVGVRVGGTWEIPLEQMAGAAMGGGGQLPSVRVRATLDGVDGDGAEQVARVGYNLPQQEVTVPAPGGGPPGRMWVEVEGSERVRVRDAQPVEAHLRLVMRMGVPGAPGGGANAPEMLMNLQIDERGEAEELLADPPVPPW